MSIVIIGATVVVLTAISISESEIIKIIKEVIFQLVKFGYETQKIIQIIRFYGY
jgi:hypothetical protein